MLILRVVIGLHALGIVTQAVLAGLFLSGSTRAVVLHEWIAWITISIAAVQIGVVLVRGLEGPGLILAISSLFVFLGEVLQTGTGYGRFLGVHIPLGVFLFGAVTWQLVEVLRPRAQA